MESTNRYPIDVESSSELARLLLQERILTRASGIFPSVIEPQGNILDVACGPGGWLLEAAYKYPEISGIGVDISQTMTAYAQAQAEVQGLENVRFRVMDVTRPLDFPDGSFDIVNTRFLFSFMSALAWPQLLAELYRILRPSGLLVWTETELGGTSNSAAYEHMARLSAQAISAGNRTFSADGMHLGLTPVMPGLLKKAGFEIAEKYGYLVDSSESPGSDEANLVSLRLVKPFVVSLGLISEKEWEELYDQLSYEIQSGTYVSVFCLHQWVTQKPG